MIFDDEKGHAEGIRLELPHSPDDGQYFQADGQVLFFGRL